MKSPFVPLAISLCLLASSSAFVAPDIYQRRSQVLQWLPYTQVVQWQAWVDRQPLPLTPHSFVAKLQQDLGPGSLARNFYAGCLYLERMEATLQAYSQRASQLEKEQKTEELRERLAQARQSFQRQHQQWNGWLSQVDRQASRLSPSQWLQPQPQLDPQPEGSAVPELKAPSWQAP